MLDTLSGVPCNDLLHPQGREGSSTLRFVMSEKGESSAVVALVSMLQVKIIFRLFYF